MRARLLASAIVAPFLCGSRPANATPEETEKCLQAGELGQRLRDEAHYLEARKQFAACAVMSCPRVVQRDCSSWLEELDRSTPSVVVVVRDETNADVRGANVLCDGQAFGAAIDGRPQPVDPGRHTFAVAGEPETRAQAVIVAVGEKNRLIVLHTTKRAPPPSPPPKSNDATAPPSSSTTPLVFAGLAVVGLGTFTGFALWGKSGVSDLEENPCSLSRTCSEDEVDQVRTRFIVADVGLVVGLFGLGGALVSLLRPSPGTHVGSRPSPP